MTTREFYEAVVNANVSEELTAFASEAMVKMDQSNERNRAKNAEKAAAKAAERAPLIEALLGAVSADPKTATDLIAATGLEIKPQMVSRLLSAAIETGEVVKGKDKNGHVTYAC